MIVLKTLRPFLLCLEEDDVSKFLDFIRMLLCGKQQDPAFRAFCDHVCAKVL